MSGSRGSEGIHEATGTSFESLLNRHEEIFCLNLLFERTMLKCEDGNEIENRKEDATHELRMLS